MTSAPSSVSRRTANDGRVILEDIPEIPERIAESLKRFHNVRSAALQDFSGDGRSVYITTRFAGTPQLHRVDAPGGARRQLTFFDEPVQEVCRRPGTRDDPVRDDLVFLMDQGGDERYQIFSLEPSEGEARRLTDGRGRNGSLLWSPDGKHLACRSTRRNGRSSDVWLTPGDDPDHAELVVEAPNPAWWGPAAWSPDGRLLAILEYRSVTDRRVHLLDVESGELRCLAGDRHRPGNFDPLAFSADGASLFLRTDADSEFLRLGRLDLDTERLEIVVDLPWDVSTFKISQDRAAFVLNESGYGRLYLLDPKSGRFAPVPGLPRGIVERLRFSPDGNRLGFTLQESTGPGDVWTLDLESSAPHPGPAVRWTESEVGGLARSRFVEPELVAYPTFDRVDDRPREIPAFVYRPQGSGPHPVVIRIHGGPESQFRPGWIPPIQAWVDRLGVAVIAPNVRGSNGYGRTYLELDNGFLREDSVKDIGCLLDWIAQQPDLDDERVAVYGGSYGGYMVLASLTHFSDRLRCGVDLVGISNFVTFLENTKAYRRDLRRVEYGDERDPEMREFLDRISPNRNAHRMTAPLFVAQGHNDPRVPYTEAEQIVADVRATGQQVWYLDALDEGHGFRKKVNRDLFEQAVVYFLERHLI